MFIKFILVNILKISVIKLKEENEKKERQDKNW